MVFDTPVKKGHLKALSKSRDESQSIWLVTSLAVCNINSLFLNKLRLILNQDKVNQKIYLNHSDSTKLTHHLEHIFSLLKNYTDTYSQKQISVVISVFSEAEDLEIFININGESPIKIKNDLEQKSGNHLDYNFTINVNSDQITFRIKLSRP